MRRRSSVSPTSAHSIDGSRILNTITCLDRAYTGYIDVEARHHFFYFFESRNDPDSDDVLFWTNGGPGGSSALGLFSELGPFPTSLLRSAAAHIHP